MTVQEIRPDSFDEAINILTGLADRHPEQEIVFRGQADFDWKLRTSYERYWGAEDSFACEDQHLKRLVEKFKAGLARLDFELGQIPSHQHLTWLEFARHHGLPAPLLDFSWSPFVALYFAFNCIRESPKQPDRGAAVYALNLTQLAKERAREQVDDIGDLGAFRSATENFLHGGSTSFSLGYPENSLLFVRCPSAHTRRMLAQQGVFLYSTMHLPDEEGCLETYLDSFTEGFDSPSLPNTDDPVVSKICLPYSWANRVFSRLELMSITGANLLLSPEGVATDVFNSFHYTGRSAYLRNG